MITSQTVNKICTDCGGNGFKWLDIPNLITETCNTCNNTGEIRETIVKPLINKDTYVNERGL